MKTKHLSLTRHLFPVRPMATLLLMILATLGTTARADNRTRIVFHTDKGDIRIALYDETPRHRDNIVKLVGEGFYDGLLFHRVIKSFMIQGGDGGSRDAAPDKMLGDTPESYTLPAEIRYPTLFHKRGVLAAAREGDDVNPGRDSSMSQFYIVCGRKFTDAELDKIQERIDRATQGTVKLTPDIRKVYREVGGTPHLDGQYTVFGEVIEGMEAVEAIENAPTNDFDRPLEDIRIIKAEVEK